MTKYYNVTRMAIKVQLADGSVRGLSPRREAEIDDALISAELQELLTKRLVIRRGGMGQVVTGGSPADLELIVEVPAVPSTSTIIQEPRDIVCNTDNSVVSLALISENMLDSDINDDGEIKTAEVVEDEQGPKPRTRRRY